jgi:thiol:disulfide interchange protein DsbD
MPRAVFFLSGLTESLLHHPLAAIAALFGAGLVTSLSPCIYPMIPITVGLFGGTTRSETPRRRVVGLTLTYVLGLSLFYALLGLAAGLSGSLFGAVASNPWVRLAVGNLLVVFALGLLDVIPMNAPQRLAAWAGSLAGGSYPAVFLLGATSGIVAAPCGAPAFGAVLTWVATTKSGALGFLYLFVFSLGMTAVLAVVGIFSGTLAALPKPGPWMVWIKRAAAVVLLLVAEYYFVQVGKTL